MTSTIPTEIHCRATARARGLFIVSLALIAAGIVLVDGTLGALGLAGIVLLVVLRWLGARNLERLSITIEAPQRATARAAYPLRVTIANTRRLIDAYHISLRAVLPGGAQARFDGNWIAAGSAADFDTHATPQTRADGREIPLILESTFPLGLFAFECKASHPHAMVVMPSARNPRESPGHGATFDASPLAGASFGSAGGDIRGLRVWRCGDSPRQISWPASMRSIARGSAPVVRETDPPGFLPHRCLIVLHSFASGGTLIRPERFERAIELAGGWIERLHALGIRTRIMADFDGWTSRSAETRDDIIRCRETLARAKRRNSTEAHELQHALSREAEDGEMVILLSDMPAAAWQLHIPKRSPEAVITKV
ncbi:MAG: DUF58 domain-containing protein [Luteolibacter sp.]